MTRDDSTRVRVTPEDCTFMVHTLDLFMASSTDEEVLRNGDACLDLRNRFTRAKTRAESLRAPVYIEGLARP